MPNRIFVGSAEQFAKIARELSAEPTIGATLQRIVDFAAENIEGCDGAGILLVDRREIVVGAWVERSGAPSREDGVRPRRRSVPRRGSGSNRSSNLPTFGTTSRNGRTSLAKRSRPVSRAWSDSASSSTKTHSAPSTSTAPNAAPSTSRAVRSEECWLHMRRWRSEGHRSIRMTSIPSRGCATHCSPAT